MLSIEIGGGELYDERSEEFIVVKPTSLKLEHSLVSISKWESRWKKPFLDRFHDKSYEETIDYIRCMTLTQNVDPKVYYCLTPAQIKAINDYINTEQTATTFSDKNGKSYNRQVVTSELIYYWMFGYGIPIDCQKWHRSRLLTLIRIMDIKSQPEKKMSTKDVLARNKALNAARRNKLHTKG